MAYPTALVTNLIGQKVNLTFDKHPNECPFCHHIIMPIVLHHYHINDRLLSGVYRCSNIRCYKIFLGYYKVNDVDKYLYSLEGVSIGNLLPQEFSDNIKECSPAFVEIYNQAFTAEQSNLHQIAGIGYRKALEFLVKDYIIESKPENAEKIKNTPLGNCINHHVNNPQIKLVASRAVVLGNDETHYVKRFENKDIKDLKILIELTVKWIEMEKLTKKYEQEMPD